MSCQSNHDPKATFKAINSMTANELNVAIQSQVIKATIFLFGDLVRLYWHKRNVE